jgi:hypothetical protein
MVIFFLGKKLNITRAPQRRTETICVPTVFFTEMEWKRKGPRRKRKGKREGKDGEGKGREKGREKGKIRSKVKGRGKREK